MTPLLWLSWSNVSLLKKTNAETHGWPRYYMVSTCSSCTVLKVKRWLFTQCVTFSNVTIHLSLIEATTSDPETSWCYLTMTLLFSRFHFCPIHHCLKKKFKGKKKKQRTISQNIKWNDYSHMTLGRIRLGSEAHLDLMGSNGTDQTETCLIPEGWIISFQNATYLLQGGKMLLDIHWSIFPTCSCLHSPKCYFYENRNPHDLT